MTKNAKWAFENKADAGTFIQNGGRLTTFDDALKLAYEEMYQDSHALRSKRSLNK